MSAIARTGAMLLNGQERASASKSAVACRTKSRYDRTARDRSPGFCAPATGPARLIAVNRRVAGSNPA